MGTCGFINASGIGPEMKEEGEEAWGDKGKEEREMTERSEEGKEEKNGQEQWQQEKITSPRLEKAPLAFSGQPRWGKEPPTGAGLGRHGRWRINNAPAGATG